MSKISFAYVFAILFGLLFIKPAFGNKNQGSYQEKYVDFKEYKIYYEVHGNSSSSKTLVFIHGWSSNVTVWENQLNSFPDYCVIAIDLPGHGKSSKETDKEYNIDLFINSINAVLIKEKIESAYFFGHSMGFVVSEVFALKYPQKTVGIGSIDGAHFEVDSDEKSQADWKEYNALMAESLNEEKGRNDFINMLFLSDTPEKIKNDILKSSKITPLSIGKRIIASMSDDMSYWEKRVVNIPCFVIHSPVYQLTNDYKDAFKKMYPMVEYHEIDGVSHYLMLEIPEVLNKLMSRYLQKVY